MSSESPSRLNHPDFDEVERAHDLQLRRMRYEHASDAMTGQLAEGVLMIAGLFIAVSGWIFGYGGPLQVNNLVIGLAITALGFAFGAAYAHTHRLSWVCPLLGVWTIVALWAVSGAATGLGALLGNIIAGAVVILAGLGMLGATLPSGARGTRPAR